jgi:hypothetical protein
MPIPEAEDGLSQMKLLLLRIALTDAWVTHIFDRMMIMLMDSGFVMGDGCGSVSIADK